MFVNDIKIGDHDFSQLVYYWFTNTDLAKENDPRLNLLEKVKKLVEVPSFNSGRERLDESRNIDVSEKSI